ncbi:MAG: hypothetical protein M0O96_10010 [Desulforhopalus sp.]|nr:hypothetical protein [Desulforhopalus sp.]
MELAQRDNSDVAVDKACLVSTVMASATGMTIVIEDGTLLFYHYCKRQYIRFLECF